MPEQPVISVRDLRKSYGAFEAVKGIDFEVHAGEVFGLLGPNGAGKTTTVEILEGLRSRTSGQVSVLGFDPETQRNDLKDRIGVCLQHTQLQEKIRVKEAIRLFAGLYSRSAGGETLLRRLQLWDKRNEFYSRLSGGQKQRLALALALINTPQVLFFDEPTVGLDPQARLEIRSLIEELREERRTIVLTTHYIEEAERLCDRVAIIDEGLIVTIGSPREIQARAGGNSHLEILCASAVPDGANPPLSDGDAIAFSQDRRRLTVTSIRPARSIVELVKWIDQMGMELEDVQLKRPTLEDVFIELTGKTLRD
jgi:ABC-2 type transport system ATP-binding protein